MGERRLRQGKLWTLKHWAGALLLIAAASVASCSRESTPSEAFDTGTASVVETIPAYIAAAVADTNRPPEDTVRDPDQKPTEVLAFAGVKPGDKIADFWPAPPYSTRLLANVAGSTGHVYGIVPTTLVKNVPEAEPDIRSKLAPHTNTTVVIQPFDAFSVPEPLDVVWMGKIYHDFPNVAEMGPLDIAAINTAIFNALKQ